MVILKLWKVLVWPLERLDYLEILVDLIIGCYLLCVFLL